MMQKWIAICFCKSGKRRQERAELTVKLEAEHKVIEDVEAESKAQSKIVKQRSKEVSELVAKLETEHKDRDEAEAGR